MKERFSHPVPPESESRYLDYKVCQEEMPYGYTDSPPPADTGDYDQRKLEMQYPKLRK